MATQDSSPKGGSSTQGAAEGTHSPAPIKISPFNVTSEREASTNTAPNDATSGERRIFLKISRKLMHAASKCVDAWESIGNMQHSVTGVRQHPEWVTIEFSTAKEATKAEQALRELQECRNVGGGKASLADQGGQYTDKPEVRQFKFFDYTFADHAHLIAQLEAINRAGANKCLPIDRRVKRLAKKFLKAFPRQKIKKVELDWGELDCPVLGNSVEAQMIEEQAFHAHNQMTECLRLLIDCCTTKAPKVGPSKGKPHQVTIEENLEITASGGGKPSEAHKHTLYALALFGDLKCIPVEEFAKWRSWAFSKNPEKGDNPASHFRSVLDGLARCFNRITSGPNGRPNCYAVHGLKINLLATEERVKRELEQRLKS